LPEVALALSIVAVLIGGYAILTLHKLMSAIEDLSTSLAHTVDKLESVEHSLEASQQRMATIAKQPSGSSLLDLLPAVLQKNGNPQWGAVALLGFRVFEAYFRKRRSLRNASAQGDVGTDSRK